MLKHQDFHMFDREIKNQPLEVVGRGSETQIQVGENLNHLI